MATLFANYAPHYDALIRTFNSEPTLRVTLACLKQQINPPRQYIIVDSGSTDQTLACVPPGSLVHRYVGSEFNFSEAINQGLKLISSEYVMIISSHTELANREAASYVLNVLNSNPGIGAAYFYGDNTGSLRHELIDRHNFTGFNGLYNTCAVIKVSLLRKRMFRPEVFSAEDQEWAGWLFATEDQAIARVSGAGLVINNPRKDSLKKKLNEYVSVAYFTNRKLLAWSHIGSLLNHALKRGTGIGLAKRKFYLLLSFRLMLCHIFRPRGRSRYF
jgi:glycosyltransferase involved in cell wall biosynthesis